MDATRSSSPTALKAYRIGTHRLRDPADTVRRLAPYLPVFGITRVADVTGLDDVGIPVVMVIRPNARSLSVSQGKGVTFDAAEASGLMESVELWHAEHPVLGLHLGSYDELRLRRRCVQVEKMLHTSDTAFGPDVPLLWVQGHDLVADEPTLVPFEAVHTDFRLGAQVGVGCFPRTSNGLASGNHRLEALSHGLCELIERDATTLWDVSSPEGRQATRLDLSTVDDELCRVTVERFERAGLAVAVWDLTCDTAVAVFHVVVADREPQPFRNLGVAKGAGCHPSRSVALLRALTEAAQSRLTVIAGSRDDNLPSGYERLRDPAEGSDRALVLDDRHAARPMAAVPDHQHDDLADDMAVALDGLAAAGIDQVVAVDLTRPEFNIPVVKVIAPGLEGHHLVENYAEGERARSRREQSRREQSRREQSRREQSRREQGR